MQVVDCAYMERRYREPPAEHLDRYRQTLSRLMPLSEPLPVILEWRTVADELHGYGFYPQALYLDGFTLLDISTAQVQLEGLALAWDGAILSTTTPRSLPTPVQGAQVFVRQSACRCPERSLDCELLTVKQYLQKTGRSLTQHTYLRACRQVGAAYRKEWGETAPDLPEQGSRAKQLWVRHYPPAAWHLIEAAIGELEEENPPN